jgi:tRNA threonylcarbamoyladenosine biosynthesis protein TsaE
MGAFRTKSLRATKALAADFVKTLLKSRKNRQKALTLLLSGDLGSGKTSFVQAILRFFGVKRVTSPTFVIMKHYRLLRSMSGIKDIYHVDAYRLRSFKDLSLLGFDEILKSDKAMVMIEWPERIKKGLPQDAVKISFSCGEKENERVINFPKINAR